ncbi:hypothetical protein EDD16DRAFT_1516224 [Pisolithus croceorrhizus]|nr:hypothetical protein F5141DRAFT_1066748 [Pisolithus sp. B1]KAI6105344.1 hypothetical protein F5141DRAFT_1203692 [Pisolithus sp. B1]KAI6128369.1 hypothetical protein EDD16DRAFT_1516224 [Pisolithus croceorrhizus]KAI6128585.1 hypothetical protein EV401DRAFT_1885183 [Pisolithus croceorrhizus]
MSGERQKLLASLASTTLGLPALGVRRTVRSGPMPSRSSRTQQTLENALGEHARFPDFWHAKQEAAAVAGSGASGRYCPWMEGGASIVHVFENSPLSGWSLVLLLYTCGQEQVGEPRNVVTKWNTFIRHQNVFKFYSDFRVTRQKRTSPRFYRIRQTRAGQLSSSKSPQVTIGKTHEVQFST